MIWLTQHGKAAGNDSEHAAHHMVRLLVTPFMTDHRTAKHFQRMSTTPYSLDVLRHVADLQNLVSDMSAHIEEF